MTRSDIKDGGPAFPTMFEGGQNNGESPYFEKGMALRDWIAGQCVAAAFGDGGNESLRTEEGETVDEATARHWGGVAKAAYIAADAMLAARKGGDA